MHDKFVKTNSHYHNDLVNFYTYNTMKNKRVLEIGSGTGYLLNAVEPSYGVGIDIDKEMVNFARAKYPHLVFYETAAEELTVENLNIDMNFEGFFDYILISNTLSLTGDIQKIFSRINELSNNDTRIIINSHNFLWRPLILLVEKFGFKNKHPRENWLNLDDIEKMLYMEDFQTIKRGQRFIFPLKIPIIEPFINKYIAPLPIINRFCLTTTIIARKHDNQPLNYSTSVIIPVRNEAGNIENAIKRLPYLGPEVEIIFIEGGSSDNTADEINRVIKKYKTHNIKHLTQKGKGKADAVWMGFDNATGDVLMILDGDLTVPPEELEKFYKIINTNKGEFVYGSRLVYTPEKQAMMTLNIFGNKFFSYIFSWLLNANIKDTLCGTKVMTSENYNKLKENRAYFGYFDPFGDFDLIFGASKLNLKFIEIPIKYKARTYGSTNISRFRNGGQLLKMVLLTLNKTKFI